MISVLTIKKIFFLNFMFSFLSAVPLTAYVFLLILFVFKKTRKIKVNHLSAMHRMTKISSMVLTKRHVTTSFEQSDHVLTIKDIPRPRSLPLFGTKLDIIFSGRGTRLHEYIDRRHKNLGSIFCEKLDGKSGLVFISDPELIKSVFINLDGKYPAHILPEPWVLYEKLYGSKRGLFFMNGEEWLTNRRLINKHLLREGCENWLQDPIRKSIADFIQTWKMKGGNGTTITNLESELYRLSTHVIINVLLGNKSEIIKSRHYDELLGIFSDSVKKIFQTTTKLYGMPVNWYQRLNLKAWRDFKESVDLSLTLAHKISNEMLTNMNGNNGLLKKLVDDNINNDTITRIVADFIIAAGDTTAYTTLWMLWLLSINKDIVYEIREKDECFIRNVVKETMRMFPVAPFLTRILPKECYLGPYKLQKGTPIIASIYTSGREEKNFSNPNAFLPYRWDRNDSRKNSLPNHISSASLPFALGARSCIGKKIAMLQLTEIVSQVVNNFEIKCTTDSEVKAITSQVLIPNQNINLTLSPLITVNSHKWKQC